MSACEAVSIIVQARREGVVLFAKVDGKLGLKGDRPPSGELLAALKEHKADILALLPQPPCGSSANERAKRMTARLRSLGFRPYLDCGVLLIADVMTTGKRRDPSEYLPIGEVFDEVVAGLSDDPKLLDQGENRNPGRIGREHLE